MFDFSVIIPTKNRISYCLEAVQSVLDLRDDRIQVVVQDNSDASNEERFHARFPDAPGLKYHYHGGTLSFVDNFSEAVEQADGQYLCMIGDDDGVLPNILQAVELARTQHYDAVVPGLNAVYCWPSEHPFIRDAENGYLVLSYIGRGIHGVSCSDALQKLMKNGAQDYQSLFLPRIYHGIVSREMMQRIYNKTGRYFDGLSPDIYNAVALSLVCDRVCRLDYPITVSGICPRSGSSDSATGKHTGKLSEAPHFNGHQDYTWSEKVPEIYSVESIWADSALCALEKFGAGQLADRFNVGYLDQLCLKKYPQFREEIRAHRKRHGVPALPSVACFTWRKTKAWLCRAFRRAVRRPGDVRKYYQVPDIRAAIQITQKATCQDENHR